MRGYRLTASVVGGRHEGLAGRQPPDARARRAGRGLVLAAHATAARDARRGSRARTRRAPLLSLVALLAGATATALAPPFLSKYAVDEGIAQDDLTKLWWIVGAFLVAGLVNWGMSYAQTYLTGWVGERILADLRNRLFDHLQRLSLGFYERNRAGVIISRLTNDVEAIDQLVTDGVTTLVQNTLTLIGTAILLFILDWRLALATLVVIPFMSVATAIFRTRSARAYRSVRERLGLVTATLAEDIAGMRVVQAFTREETNIAQLPRGQRALPRRRTCRRSS